MALVRYGGGIVQMSGSIAGNTFARNSSGNYVRARTVPVNPQSDRQNAIRTVMATLCERWEAIVTPVQREAWETYASAVNMLNKLGETVQLSGFNHYIRSNSVRLYIGAAIIDDGPTVMSLPEKDPTLAVNDENIAGQTVTFDVSALIWGAGADTLNGIAIYQGLPQLATRNFFDGPWRYMGIIDPAEGIVGAATEDAVFPFGLGQKVFFKARMLTMSGRLSEPWQFPPRVIVADI